MTLFGMLQDLRLAISYQIIVDKHGGILKCVSKLGQGAEFWIRIPVKQTRFGKLPEELSGAEKS